MKLRNYTKNRGCSIATERSRVTRRTLRTFDPNLQVKTFNTRLFGDIKLKLTVRDLRTIVKYGSFEMFLFKVKNNDISDETKMMKKSLMNMISANLKLTNLSSVLSFANRESKEKKMVLDYLESLYNSAAIA
jgi:ribosomal protein L28